MRRAAPPRTTAATRHADPRRIDGRRFSHATSAVMRLLAVQEVSQGAKPSAVMRRYGLCRTTIYRWLRLARRRGIGALVARPHPGRHPTVPVADALRVRAWLIGRTPKDHGLEGALWTRDRVGTLLRERLGVRLGPLAVGRLLARIGLDPRTRRDHRAASPSGARGLLFAVDGRGRFLCERPRRGSQGWERAIRRLRARSGPSHNLTFRFSGAPGPRPSGRRATRNL